MKVSAIVVTRGDVDLAPIWASLPPEWEQVTWNNAVGGHAFCQIHKPGDVIDGFVLDRSDVSVYGRYAAIEYATGDVIYVQDDDCVVGDPQGIVDAWLVPTWGRTDHVVCNMPPEFRHDFYQEHALVGFGAAFHRDAPRRAFERFGKWQALQSELRDQVGPEADRRFHNTCDIVFTGLTPRILIEWPKVNLPWATDDGRMYRQPEHMVDRTRMLEWVKEAAKHVG